MHGQSAAINQKHNEDGGQNTPNYQQNHEFGHTVPRLHVNYGEAYHYLPSPERSARLFLSLKRWGGRYNAEEARSLGFLSCSITGRHFFELLRPQLAPSAPASFVPAPPSSSLSIAP